MNIYGHETNLPHRPLRSKPDWTGIYCLAGLGAIGCLIVLAVAFWIMVMVTGCVTDSADKKLSRIERRQEAEQIARRKVWVFKKGRR